MNNEDGDVSMASMRDEYGDMSLDHEAIDVVWQSTQSTTLQSILEESKLRKPRPTSSTKGNPNSPAPFVLPGSLLPKSLFRDTSTTRSISMLENQQPSISSLQRQFQPTGSRKGSVPSVHEAQRAASSGSARDPSPDTMADMRKIRPSQRRSSTRDQITQSSESAEVTQQDLESLKYMINTVSRIWGQERPSTTGRASTSAKPTSDLSTRQGSSGSQPRRLEPVKTIKLGRVPEPSQSQSRQMTSEVKGLMLPPALPATTNPFERKPPFPTLSKPPTTLIPQKPIEDDLCDVSMMAEEAETETSFDLSEPPSPSPTIRANPKAFQRTLEAPAATREKRLSQGSTHPPSTNLLAQLRGGTQRSLSQNPVPTANIAQKALGMRRTASGNNAFFSNATKRDTETTPPLSRTQISKSQEQSGMNTKGFKVPWAAESPNLAPNSLPASQTSNLSVSSPVSESGSDSAPIVSGRRSASTTVQHALPENPDSSYSFDDIDTEELHRVLSQCGA